MSGLRQGVLFAVSAVALACVGLLLIAAVGAQPAGAFRAWQHDGAMNCVCHDIGTPTNASCTSCHTGFVSVSDDTCWSCHYPGEDISSLASPSSACSQACHLYDPVNRSYDIAFSHGPNPHLGSTPDCLACHQTSAGVADPGQSPHHNGPQGFTDCAACHDGYQKHAGAVVCATCHPTAAAFHEYQATSPGFKNCRSCHAKKHAGKKVAQSKCASCHKGRGSGGAAKAQHSTTPTKKRICSACHSKALHASKRGSGITSCGRCHKGHFHAAQRIPGNSVCTACHSRASRHTNGYSCTLCHRSAVHNARPVVVKIR